MNTFTTIILAIIIVLGPLIFVHELGHFLFAKLFGVRVLKFSLGFGPKLIGKVVGETEYVISALPLGGYVKMFGENPDEQDVADKDRDAAYAHKSVGRRFLIVFCRTVVQPALSGAAFFRPLYGDGHSRVGGINEDRAGK